MFKGFVQLVIRIASLESPKRNRPTVRYQVYERTSIHDIPLWIKSDIDTRWQVGYNTHVPHRSWDSERKMGKRCTDSQANKPSGSDPSTNSSTHPFTRPPNDPSIPFIQSGSCQPVSKKGRWMDWVTELTDCNQVPKRCQHRSSLLLSQLYWFININQPSDHSQHTTDWLSRSLYRQTRCCRKSRSHCPTDTTIAAGNIASRTSTDLRREGSKVGWIEVTGCKVERIVVSRNQLVYKTADSETTRFAKKIVVSPYNSRSYHSHHYRHIVHCHS